MALLSLNGVEVVFDRVFLAIKGVSIEVPERGLVALLGGERCRQEHDVEGGQRIAEA
jgi:hypothetical protein